MEKSVLDLTRAVGMKSGDRADHRQWKKECLIKKYTPGAVKMSRWFRTLAALAEDLGSIQAPP